ncbi:pseudouridine synthase [uncultured Corynebacterium sp.]|uniref:pseudouridine synthase n=1 Tax=uncultured Corynebacterium sp. TaxID=159447 RepID=UPI0025F848EE|nr:pseudouridine synthase [uncultured Corynebacterium sp.]
MGRAPGNRDEWWGADKGAGAATRHAALSGSASDHPEPSIPFEPVQVALEEGVVVVDKPPFLPSTPNGRLVRTTVQQRLRDALGEPDLTCIHRLDRLTSGVMLVSRDPATRGAYQRLFQDGLVSKTYECLTVMPDDWSPGESRVVAVELANVDGERGVRVRGSSLDDGAAADPSRVADSDIAESSWREATARVTFVGPVDAEIGDVLGALLGGGHGGACGCGTCGTRMTVAKWRLEPTTGRTHQLRATMAHLGYPILGDDTYPDDLGLDLADTTRPLRLVATELAYDDPLDGRRRVWRSGRNVTAPIDVVG